MSRILSTVKCRRAGFVFLRARYVLLVLQKPTMADIVEQNNPRRRTGAAQEIRNLSILLVHRCGAREEIQNTVSRNAETLWGRPQIGGKGFGRSF